MNQLHWQACLSFGDDVARQIQPQLAAPQSIHKTLQSIPLQLAACRIYLIICV